ncbi:hypothetical protein LIER_03679 [Lithospermum erythrorhizon]|uniref:Uncharacterized protein n=1 Tax=Lithospermum erythrorhizon TaxID=34254 RepID=A0AAV3NYP4_LITER
MSTLERRARDAEEALPQRVEKAIYDYQGSEDFHLEVEWFAPLDISTPLTPSADEEEEDSALPAPAS